MGIPAPVSVIFVKTAFRIRMFLLKEEIARITVVI